MHHHVSNLKTKAAAVCAVFKVLQTVIFTRLCNLCRFALFSDAIV